MAQRAGSIVVAVSSDSHRAELLNALLRDRNDYDVFHVESIAHGYSRIKEVRPDLIVLFLGIEEAAACQLLSMLSIDPDVASIPVVQFASREARTAVEDVIAMVNRQSAHDIAAVQMN